ncbi:MAG: protein kinase [Polyangiaceae bacterium]|nr:protein kinase [Polyangiaceae bacterium]
MILGFVEGKADGRASVDSHLASCDACRRLVSVLAGASAASVVPSSSEPSQPSPITPGAVLANKFEVVSILGRGGMGVVVEAFHRTLGQRVALKFLQGGLAKDASAVSRFFREARAAATLGSEHVVRVLDADWLSTGEPFLALELLEGHDLSGELREKGRLAVEDAVLFILQACEALELAHQKGIVHRDIKPANLFLTRAVDGAPLVKVLDFGVAKVRKSGDGTGTTDPSAIVGSPRYMSPEQLQASGSVGPQADVWALAVTLFELLTGGVPFQGDNLLEICAAIVSGPARRLDEVRADVPAGLADALSRALEKDLSVRTPSILSFAEAIAPFAGEAGISRIARLRRIARASQPPPPTSSIRIPHLSQAAGADSTLAASSLGSSRAATRSTTWPWLVGAAAVLAIGVALFVTREHPVEPGAASGRATQTPVPEAVVTATAEPTVTQALPIPSASTELAATEAPVVSATPNEATHPSPKTRSAPGAQPATAGTTRPSSSPIHRDGLLDRK